MKGKRVMNTVTKVAVTSVIAVCAQGLCAAEITWGGSSGRWHTKSNWIGGVVPAAEDYVIFPAGADYTVEITDNTAAVSKIRLLPGPGRVTFLGDKKIAIRSGDGYVFSVGENREAVIDGSKVILDATGGTAGVEVEPNATLDVNGRLCLEYGDILVNTNATLNVRGGQIEYENDGKSLILAKNSTVNFMGGSNIIARIVNKISTNGDAVISEFDGEGSRVIFSGGYTKFPNAYSLSSYVDYSKTDFSFTGGKMEINQRMGNSLRVFLPPKDGILINKCNELAMTDENSPDNVWEIGGTACFVGDGSYPNLGWSSGNVLKGGGELHIDILRIGGNLFEADISKMVLKTKFRTHSANGEFRFNDGIAFGAGGDLTVERKKSSKFSINGKLVFDTTDADDGVTPRSFDISQRFDFSGVTSLKVEGAGYVGLVPEGSTFKLHYLHKVEVDNGATVALTNGYAAIKTMTLAMGDNSYLLTGSNAVDVVSSVVLGTGAKIRYSFDTLDSGRMYPLWFGPHNTTPPVENFEFSPALPEGWSIALQGGTAYLCDGSIIESDLEDTSYWQGKNGGNWNVSENWGNAKIPGQNSSWHAIFSGNRQLSVTNDYSGDLCYARNLTATLSAGPYVISGLPFAACYPYQGANSSSIANASAFPLVIESVLYKYGAEGLFRVQGNSNAPVVMPGGGLITNAVLSFRGDVRVGGEWRMHGLLPEVTVSARNSRLTTLPGALVYVSNQASNQTVKSSYHIAADSGMTVEGDVWRWISNENTHFVDGVVTSTCPVQATARQTFIGDGVLSLAMVQSDAEGVGDLKFAESITVRPAGWKTVRAGADNPMTMVVRGNATIGAWGDWTYGAEEGFESSSTPADRALKVVGGAKTYVSFDTEGNTITLNDPLVVEKWSTVLKKGEGALVLKSDENDLGDSEIELHGGELRLNGPETFGKLTFAGGRIAIDDGFNADTYTPIFTAKKIIGEVTVAGRYSVKTVTGENDVTVSVRRKRGTAVILR